MASLKYLQDLNRTLVSFLDELIEMFPQEGQFIAFRIMIKDQIPITSIHAHFVKNLLPEKGLIQSRNKVFFAKNVLFAHLGDAQSENFRRLFLSLDEEDQQAIWRWLDAFVILTEKCLVS